MTRLARFALLLALAAVPAAVLPASAQEAGETFHFGIHTKHTNITFTSEADIENIYGMTHSASGTAWIDFEGGKGKASITVPVKDMETGIPTRDEHMRSDQWLDEANHPNITFAADSFEVTAKNKDKGLYEAKVTGKMSIHGVTKELTSAAKITLLPDSASKVLGEGHWVRVVTAFDVKLSDFGVTIPDGPVKGKVNDTWAIKFDCYAGTVVPEKK